MDESMFTLLILGAELGALVLLIAIVMFFFAFRRKQSDKKYVSDFIDTYKKDMPAHRDGFKTRLECDCYIVGEDADDVLDNISDSETRLQKRVLNLYLGNNRACLLDVRKDIASLSETWMDTIGTSLSNASEVLSKPEVIAQLQDDYDSLKSENAVMKTELKDAMQSMEEMLAEYSLLYAESTEKNETMERLSDEYDEIKAKTESHEK